MTASEKTAAIPYQINRLKRNLRVSSAKKPSIAKNTTIPRGTKNTASYGIEKYGIIFPNGGTITKKYHLNTVDLVKPVSKKESMTTISQDTVKIHR